MPPSAAKRDAGVGWPVFLGTAVVCVVLGGFATGVLYSPTLDYGFEYDDYHFVHPFSRAEVAAAFHGPWDPAGIEAPYFRPLTVAGYALRFHLFGINSWAYHAASLALFAGAAAACGWLVLSLTGERWPALLGTILFVVHPAMPYSLVAWVTNQMHLFGMLVVLGALLWWRAARSRGPLWWAPLLGAAAAAFFVKEDGVMLLPTVIALHGLGRWLDPRSKPVPVAFLAASAFLLAALLWWRADSLAGHPAPRLPSWDAAWARYELGLERVFRLVPATRPWQGLASWFVTLLPIAAVLVWRRASAGAKQCLLSGLVIALFFNLPFIFITKGEQMHVVAFGAVLVLAGAAWMFLDAWQTAAWRWSAGAVLAAGCVVLGVVARDITADFRPDGPAVRAHDRIVMGWAAVPQELRQMLEKKGEPDARVPPNPVDALDVVAFGLHPEERAPDGRRLRWMSGSVAELHVAARMREVRIPIRHERGAFGEAARVRISSDGLPLEQPVLDNGDWRTFHIALRSSGVSRLSRTHTIVVSIDHAWVPSALISGSQDTRTLGLQIGEIELR